MIRVVCADDSPFLRKVLKDFLESTGKVTVVGEAKNGKEAIDQVAALKPDILILDCEMPVMNGLEVLETIKRNNKYTNIPVLIVSTESEDDKMSQAFAAGAKGYISKPFTPERLLNLVRGRISV